MRKEISGRLTFPLTIAGGNRGFTCFTRIRNPFYPIPHKQSDIIIKEDRCKMCSKSHKPFKKIKKEIWTKARLTGYFLYDYYMKVNLQHALD